MVLFMDKKMAMRSRWRRSTALAVTLLLAGACAADGDAGSSPTTTSLVAATSIPPGTDPPPPTSTTSPAGRPPRTAVTPTWTPEEQAVVDAYLGFTRAFHEASAQGNPDHPDLRRFSTGDVLKFNTQEIAVDRANGERSRDGDQRLAVTAVLRVNISGAAAAVAVCEVNDFVVYRVADGTVMNDRVITQRRIGHLQRNDQGWQVDADNPDGGEWAGDQLEACRR